MRKATQHKLAEHVSNARASVGHAVEMLASLRIEAAPERRAAPSRYLVLGGLVSEVSAALPSLDAAVALLDAEAAKEKG